MQLENSKYGSFNNYVDIILPFLTTYLHYGFYKKSLRKDATLTNWTLFSSQKGTCKYYRYPLVVKKVFNWSGLHLSEVTSYKIHTLIIPTFEEYEKNDTCGSFYIKRKYSTYIMYVRPFALLRSWLMYSVSRNSLCAMLKEDNILFFVYFQACGQHVTYL